MVKEHLHLSAEDREHLQQVVSQQNVPLKVFRRAKALLLLEEGSTLQGAAQAMGVDGVVARMVAAGQSVYPSMYDKETEGAIPPAQGAPGNWREYNQALVQRGSLTLWVDEAALTGWRNHEKSGGRGASLTYKDSAIVCALTLQSVYHLPLRAIRPEGTRGCCARCSG